MSGEILERCDICGREVVVYERRRAGNPILCSGCVMGGTDRPSPGLEPPRPAGCPSCAQAEAQRIRMAQRIRELEAALDLEAKARAAMAEGLAQAKACIEARKAQRIRMAQRIRELEAAQGDIAFIAHQQGWERAADRIRELEAAMAEGLAQAKVERDRLAAMVSELAQRGTATDAEKCELARQVAYANARLAAIDAARQGEPPMPQKPLNYETLSAWGRQGWDAAAALRVEVEEQRHQANEWADIATSGLQWLRNLRDGIAFPEVAIENMEQLIGDLRAGRRVAIPDPAIHAEDLVEALDDEPHRGFHEGHDTFEEVDGDR